MRIPQFSFQDRLHGLPRQPVPLRLAYLITTLPFPWFLALLAERHFDRYQHLTAYEYAPGYDPLEVPRIFYADVQRNLPSDACEHDLVARLCPNHFVWSDDLASGFSMFIGDCLSREQGWSDGIGLIWNPALRGLEPLLDECVDLSDISSLTSNSADAAPQYLFRRSRAGGWEIRFAGLSCGPFKDSIGLRYLQHLLQNARVRLSSQDLYSLVAQPSLTPDQEAAAEAFTSDLASSDGVDPSFRITAGGDAGDMIDERARRAYTGRLLHLRDEFDEAKEMGDTDRQHEISAEIEFVGAELNSAIGSGGRLRKVKSDRKKQYDAVRVAIKRVIEQVVAHCPELGQHLNQSVRHIRGDGWEYHPSTKVDWKF